MKNKILTCVALSVISTTVLADSGVRIISENLTKSSNFTGSIYSIGYGRSDSTKAVSGSVRVSPRQGWAGTPTRVDATHTINITNFDKHNNRYTYTYTLKCADKFANYQRTIELKPGASFSDQGYSYTEVNKKEAGNWKIEGQTKIEGAETMTARDESNLNLHK